MFRIAGRQLHRAIVMAVGLALLPLGAGAYTDFVSMPVGCSWEVSYSDGTRLRETFIGEKSGLFVTEVTKATRPHRLVRRVYFDHKGRMVQKTWASGKWEKFAPYSCFGGPGRCSYRYTNADGADQVIDSRTTRQGKGRKVVAGPRGEDGYPDEYFETGAFGVMTVNRATNYSARVTGFEGCGAADNPAL
jgi:hypothetical protein